MGRGFESLRRYQFQVTRTQALGAVVFDSPECLFLVLLDSGVHMVPRIIA